MTDYDDTQGLLLSVIGGMRFSKPLEEVFGGDDGLGSVRTAIRLELDGTILEVSS